MANIVRFEPMREMMTLREAMNQLFDDSFTRPFGVERGMGLPELEMYQDKDNVVVKAALPGYKPEQVNVRVTGDLLTLSGDVEQETEQKDRTYHLREHRIGHFERSIALPCEVSSEKANAEFANGMLTITMPKSESVKPRTITIKAK